MTHDKPQPSCYLLEFSVKPGGARLGEVCAHGTLAGLQGVEATPLVDLDLLVTYGAVLHLWVVRRGEITQGIDLHPFLRTGSPDSDRTLARLLAGEARDSPQVLEILESHPDDPRAALVLLTRFLASHDGATGAGAESGAGRESGPDDLSGPARPLGGGGEDGGEGDLPSADGSPWEGLDLDWDALASVVPRLEEPLLGPGGVAVRWAEGVVPHPDSYLTNGYFAAVGEDGGTMIYAGRNDLENGDNERLYEEDDDLE
ncbi:hypothetical protein ACIBCM_32390 [Streptomyces sp. NPDC051018]|uniref:hypothetical protein n=1 Tax=Streptomyces sp. NPDC051018 TaxID=3365639 RepID=UPI00379FDCE0